MSHSDNYIQCSRIFEATLFITRFILNENRTGFLVISHFKTLNKIQMDNSLERRKILMTNSEIYLLSTHFTNINNDETFPQDLLLILKHLLQNYQKILKKCLLSTTWTVMLSTDSNVEPHADSFTLTKDIALQMKCELLTILFCTKSMRSLSILHLLILQIHQYVDFICRFDLQI